MTCILSAQCKAIARPSIGSLSTIELPFPVGTPIGEVVRAFAPQLPARFWIDGGVVIIDDNPPLAFELWDTVTIRPGQAISLVVLPQGESGRLIAQIAIVAASAAAYAIPGVGPFVSAAIGIGGTLALNYFFPAKTGRKSKPPKQFGEGGMSGNVLEAYAQIPTLLGRRRISPNYGAPPFSVRDKENVTSRAIILLSGQCRMRDPQEYGVPLDTLQEYYYEGDLSDHPLKLFTETVWQEEGRELSRHSMKTDTSADERLILSHSPSGSDVTKYDLPKWSWFKLGRKALPRMVEFDLCFDRGVYKTDNNKGGIGFLLGLKKENGDIVYLPSPHIIGNVQSKFYVKIRFIFTEDPAAGLGSPSTSKPWTRAFGDADYQLDFGYDCDPYYVDPGALREALHTYCDADDESTLVIYVDPNEVDVSLGMSIGIKASCGYFNSRFQSDGDYAYAGGAALTWDYWTYVNSGGDDTAVEDQAKVVSDVRIEYVTRYYDTKPLELRGEYAALEVETQNQRTTQFSVYAERMINKKWENSAWIDAPHVSENAGEQSYDIITNNLPSLNQLPVEADMISAASFGAYAAHCFENQYTCNPYIPSGNVEQALQWCMESGRGWLVRNDLWEVYIDRNRSGDPVDMVFSPRNYRDFSFDKAWEDEVHGVRVMYDDRLDDYQTDPNCIVYGPGHTAETARLLEELPAPWCVNRWEAEEFGRYWLRERYFRDRRYSIVTNSSHLVVKRGSLVGLNHYVLNEYHGAAAVREVYRRDIGGVPKIVGVRLDGAIETLAATNGFTLTSFDLQIITATAVLTAGMKREIYFDTPLADNDAIEEGCTLTSGLVGVNYIRCLIKDIQAERNGGARLTLVDEAPQIFGADDLYASPDLYGEDDLYNLNQ